MKKFPLRLLIVLIMGVSANAANVKEEPKYRLTAGKGYSVCEAYLKNLNAFPATDPPMLCEQKIHPTHPEFTKPDWQEMDVQGNLSIIYQMAMFAMPYTNPETKMPGFDEWKKQFEERLRDNPMIVPRLLIARLALNENGPEDVIWYRSYPMKCPNNDDDFASSQIFVLRDGSPQTIERILGVQFSLYYSEIVIFRGKVFFVRVYNDGAKEIHLSPVFSKYRLYGSRDEYVIQDRCQFKAN